MANTFYAPNPGSLAPNPITSPEGPHSPNSSSMTELAPPPLPSCLPLSTPLPPSCLKIPRGAAPAVWEVAAGTGSPRPGSGLGARVSMAQRGGTRDSAALSPRASCLLPGPRQGHGCQEGRLRACPTQGQGRLSGRVGGSWRGARPRRVELSYKCSSGRALSGLDKRGHSFLEARDGQGGREWAQRAGETWEAGG